MRDHSFGTDGTDSGSVARCVSSSGETAATPSADAVARARALAVEGAAYDGERHKQHALVGIVELLGGTVPDGVDRGRPA